MAMVMPAPSSRLLMGLEVMRLSRRSSLPPAIFSRLLDMTVMPYKKKANPPHRVKSEKMFISDPFLPEVSIGPGMRSLCYDILLLIISGKAGMCLLTKRTKKRRKPTARHTVCAN